MVYESPHITDFGRIELQVHTQALFGTLYPGVEREDND